MRIRYRVAAVVAVTALAAGACGSSSKSQGSSATTAAGSSANGSGGGSNKASAPGVTASTVNVGMVTSLTGSAAPNYVGMDKGALARFALQNAQGGVNGRKINLTVKDDTSTPTGAATAAQLLSGGSVFAVIGESPFIFGGSRVFQTAGIPVVGGGYDGPEWGLQPNTNMFSFEGINGSVAGTDPHVPQYTTGASFIKSQGGSNVASFGYGESPSSTASAKGFAKAAQVVGIKTGLLDTSIPFGSVAVGPIALQMKQAGVDSAWLPMDNNTNFAIVTAANQAGVKMKVPVSATGYGQSLLDDQSAVTAAQGGYFLSLCAPEEVQSPATKAMQAALAQYQGFTGVPGFDWCEGYVSADLMIKGLQVAGQNPTRKSFITGLRGVTSYDAGGLLAQPANFSLAQFGKAPQIGCEYFVKLQGTKFLPVPATGKPVCGTLIPNSDEA